MADTPKLEIEPAFFIIFLDSAIYYSAFDIYSGFFLLFLRSGFFLLPRFYRVPQYVNAEAFESFELNESSLSGFFLFRQMFEFLEDRNSSESCLLFLDNLDCMNAFKAGFQSGNSCDGACRSYELFLSFKRFLTELDLRFTGALLLEIRGAFDNASNENTEPSFTFILIYSSFNTD